MNISNEPVIVCSADNHYAMPLAVMLRSLGENLAAGSTASVWVLDGGVSGRNKKRIERSLPTGRLDVHWIRIDETMLQNMPVFGHVSMATYYRLLIPSILPAEIHQAVYLDVDIVVKGDIGELWAMEAISQYPLMAVEDSNWQSSEAARHRVVLGMNAESVYFNAGVLYVNVDEWRNREVPRKVMEYLSAKKGQIKWHDQDGLNAVLEGCWGRLDACWNFRVDPIDEEGPREEDHANAKIIHYASAVKPWDFYAKNPAVQMFYTYLNRTEWKGWKPRKPWRATLGNKYWYGEMIRKLPVLGRLWAAIRSNGEKQRCF